MRLIDSDKLKDAINNSLNTGRETFPVEIMYEAIDAQPTAYDQDKVLDQLWDASFERFGCDTGMGGELVVNMDDVIEIVKAGGADAEH